MRQSVDALAPHGARTTTRCDNRGAERERETRGAVWDFWRRRDVGCEGAATKLPANKRERERGKRCDNWLRVKRIEKRCFVCARDRVRKVSRVPDPRLNVSATVYGRFDRFVVWCIITRDRRKRRRNWSWWYKEIGAGCLCSLAGSMESRWNKVVNSLVSFATQFIRFVTHILRSKEYELGDWESVNHCW